MNYRTQHLSTRKMVDMALITDSLTRSAAGFSKGGPLHYGDMDRPSPWAELTRFVEQSSDRYHSAVMGDVTVNVGCLAGRVMITFVRGEKSVTLLGAEGEVKMGCGMHGISASAGEAEEMIETAIKNWDINSFKVASHLSII